MGVTQFHLGTEALLVMVLYLMGTIGIGLYARSRARDDTPGDYFLGGKTTGAVVLFFTMQATQYSGNAFFGFTGMGYRSGLIWILVVPLIGLIITTQLSYAPRLYKLSKTYHYLTPGDFYAHRYNSNSLRLIVALLTIVSMFPYLMIQAEATGYAVVALSSGKLPFWSGVVFISIVMGIYISIGGWRGVVWTDALQGLLLTIAMLAATFTILKTAGGLDVVLETLDRDQPQLLTAPDSFKELTSRWLSLLIVSAIGFAMYPHAVQRIYAANSELSLKKSFTAMLCVPFLLGICTLIIGLTGASLHPGLTGIESDQIFGLLLKDIVTRYYWLVVFILCGLLAAIMSTASSVVLTLSSIFTHDIYQSSIKPTAANRELRFVSKAFVFLILTLVVFASVNPSLTLWRLTEIKIEFLMQLFPALILGLYWQRISKGPAIAGILAGSFLVILMTVTGHSRWWLFQAGLYGFALNLTICIIGSLGVKPDEEEQRRIDQLFNHSLTVKTPAWSVTSGLERVDNRIGHHH